MNVLADVEHISSGRRLQEEGLRMCALGREILFYQYRPCLMQEEIFASSYFLHFGNYPHCLEKQDCFHL